MNRDVRAYWDALRARVETALEELARVELPVAAGAFGAVGVGNLRAAHDTEAGRAARPPARLAESMRYSLLAGGKRLRPILALGTCEAMGRESTLALWPALGLECIHTYSLIHDDLPALDDDDLRRGQPTNHRVFGEATALLAGDALLTLAFDLLARPIPSVDPARQLWLVRRVAELAGPAWLVGGQVDDLAGEAADLAGLDWINQRKTGAMFVAAVEVGAVAAGAWGEADLAPLLKYAAEFGRAFQLTDDILDVVGDPALTGKSVGRDARQHKRTLIDHLGLDEARRQAALAVERAQTALEPLGPAGWALAGLAASLIDRSR